ncbi:MAG: patatin-like phospholipase family protein [Burkholderiales bacterium]|uniref:patatin-like phospholipase family protein n=1 Tax=Inhella sp. TaxID=1921806 RepID=UPI001AD08FA5|nr:patatin-like phospholipase family protein [Burkholderiales bacterium]
MHQPVNTGLVLMGGGARAAYQAGVLQAVAQLKREAGVRGSPFDIFVGTSAGAINSAALACVNDRFELAVDVLGQLWAQLGVEHVYRADALGVMRSGSRWMTMLSVGWAMRKWRRTMPRSLLDNSPLREFLQDHIHLGRLPRLIERGHLRALAISGSSYTTGEHITFYQSRERVAPWTRSQRRAVPGPITLDHLVASSAIPFIFPAQPVAMADGTEWLGDGSMRQSAPMSPAVHLGAERVFVIGAGRMQEARQQTAQRRLDGAPGLAHIAGHAMSSIFLDALSTDIERAQRINKTLALLTPEQRAGTPLRAIDVLVIAPSRRLDELAGEHQHELPGPIRALLGAVGVRGKGRAATGSALASYLLFVPGYVNALIELGAKDALAQREAVRSFFGWDRQDQLPRTGSAPGGTDGSLTGRPSL